MLRRAGSCLLAVVVGLAAGAIVGLGVVATDTSPPSVTRAVLGQSQSSLVSPDAAGAPPRSERLLSPSPASVVALAARARAARPAITTGDIPPAAWEAYLRATAVLTEAAPRCRLDWPVLAAIGLVESDHGRDLPEPGSSTVAGPAAPDTDGGRLDGDPRRDVPVGPMRLLPSTWQVIGVDGDGDGVRSPTDPDDAALAVGVALCAGDSDLGTPAGLRRALLRFAPSPAYVDLVVGIARAYGSERLGLPAASLTVTAVAHPVVEDTRTRLAHRSLARRVEEAQAVAAASVGVGTSPTAELLAAAQAGEGPSPSAGAAVSGAPSPSTGGLAPELPEDGSVGSASAGPTGEPSGATAGPAPTDEPVPSADPTGSGQPSDSPTTPDPTASDPPPSDPPASDPPPSDPPPSDPPASDPPASDPPAPEPSPTEPPATDPASPTPDAPADACPSPDPGTTGPATDPTADPTPCPDAPAPTAAGAPADAPLAVEPSATQSATQPATQPAG